MLKLEYSRVGLGNVQISYDASGRGRCSNRQSTVIWREGFGPNRHKLF